MIDALESLNLTQRSQSNAKEMSWNKRGCFGSAQYAHKNVKSPRVGVKSWLPSIYRGTLRKEPLGSLRDRRTRLSLTRQMQCPAYVAPPCATCPRASKFQRSSSNRQTRPMLARPGVYRTVRHGPERVKPHGAMMNASVASAIDVAQRLSLLCTEATLTN
jgi:hypothetical protein